MAGFFGAVAVTAAMVFSVSAKADFAADMVRGKQSYEVRGYDAAGAKNAKDAYTAYGEAVKATALRDEQAKALVEQSRAASFWGSALTVKDEKMAVHILGMDAAKAALKLFGVANPSAITAKEKASLKSLTGPVARVAVEAVYFYGANLGQWGAENKGTALSRWPELAGIMQVVLDLGQKDIHAFGALRTLGRGNNLVPKMFGGDLEASVKYLREAVNATKVPGKTYSYYGFNNWYLAAALYDLGIAKGDEALKLEASDLVDAFAGANAKAAGGEYAVEFAEAQAKAVDMQTNW